MKIIQKNLFEGINNHVNPNKVVLIPHIVNNKRGWGAGFVVPLGNRFPEARAAFYAENNPTLGNVQFVNALTENVIICNMFAQDGIGFNNGPPIRYDALEKCMTEVRVKALELANQGKQVIIAAPLFGVGLAGGKWEEIENRTVKYWVRTNPKIDVEFYFLKELLPRDLIAININEIPGRKPVEPGQEIILTSKDRENTVRELLQPITTFTTNSH